jgi:hypothetical protein
MQKAISRVLIAALATLSLTASVIATVEPASAGYWDRDGRHEDAWDRDSRRGWDGGTGGWGGHAHAAPAPEADVGLAGLVMVGMAALATYWRKRNCSGS